MHVGGTRTITMPVELGPPNIRLPPNTPLVYKVSFFFFFTLVTGPRRSLSLMLSDTKGL